MTETDIGMHFKEFSVGDAVKIEKWEEWNWWIIFTTLLKLKLCRQNDEISFYHSFFSGAEFGDYALFLLVR